MRPLIPKIRLERRSRRNFRAAFSLAICLLALDIAGAEPVRQGPGDPDNSSIPQIPFGQTYKNFQFPLYDGMILKAKLSAEAATGTTLNRADTTNLKIELYTNDKVTTTITTPRGDLYPAERRLRTKTGVHVVQNDLDATSDVADFDLIGRKYFLQNHVKVTLIHFDTSPKSTAPGVHPAKLAPNSAATAPPGAVPILSPALPADNSLPDMPGAYSNTNAAPTNPAP